MLKDHSKLQKLIDFGTEIAQIQDIDLLLDKILSAARHLVNADAGTIYIKEGEFLRFSHTQNNTLEARLPVGEKLIYHSFAVPINHRSISGYVASTGEVVNIYDVYNLGLDTAPYAFDRSYDEKTNYRTQSMLTVPLKNNYSEIIGVMQLINAHDKNDEVMPFFKKDIPIIQIFANNAAMAIERTKITRSEILGLVRVLTELRDPEETEAHVNRVGAYAAEIYQAWASQKKLSPTQIETNSEVLRMAAMLHDIGKLVVPHNLREKPGKFTAEEYEQMKQHTIKGAQMLLSSAQSDYEKIAAQIALNHHEYWDGSGYPGYIDIDTGKTIPGYENGNENAKGKRSEEIPVFGRIVAIADVFDALSCRRAFREALHEADVLKILRNGAGKRFDPEMIEAFFSRLNAIRSIGHRFPDKD